MHTRLRYLLEVALSSAEAAGFGVDPGEVAYGLPLQELKGRVELLSAEPLSFGHGGSQSSFRVERSGASRRRRALWSRGARRAGGRPNCSPTSWEAESGSGRRGAVVTLLVEQCGRRGAAPRHRCRRAWPGQVESGLSGGSRPMPASAFVATSSSSSAMSGCRAWSLAPAAPVSQDGARALEFGPAVGQRAQRFGCLGRLQLGEDEHGFMAISMRWRSPAVRSLAWPTTWRV